MQSGLVSSNASYVPETELFTLMCNSFLADVVKRASLFAIKFNLHHKRRICVGPRIINAAMKVVVMDPSGLLAKFQEAFLEFHEHKSLTPEFLDTHPEVKRVLEEHMPAFLEQSNSHRLEKGRPMSEKETCTFLMDYLFIDADDNTDDDIDSTDDDTDSTDGSSKDNTGDSSDENSTPDGQNVPDANSSEPDMPDASEDQKNSLEPETKNANESDDEDDEEKKQELQMLDPTNAAGIEQCRCDFCNTMRECAQKWDTWIPEETEQWKIRLRDALNL